MSEEKYGFVYIWRDRKHNRYYVGCHWGSTEDGYICSSTWMKLSYKKRPEDFRRRILKTNLTKHEMFEEEFRLFKKIKPEEIKVRYYNLNIKNNEVWHKYDDKIKTIGQKISAAKKGKSTGPCSSEKAKSISDAKKGKLRRITLYKGIELGKFDFKDKDILLEQGWSVTKSDEYIKFKKENQKRLVSEKLKGVKKSGPRSEAQIKQAKEQALKNSKNVNIQKKKSLKMSSLKWCHDPITKQNKRLSEVPVNWVLGKHKDLT